MKRIILAVVILMVGSRLCLAQAPVQPPMKAVVAKKAAKEVTGKVFVGKVVSVSIADPVKATKSEIVVVDEAGKKMAFLVKTTTTVYDPAWQALTIEKVKKDEKVKVKYATTKEGVEEAISIHLMK